MEQAQVYQNNLTSTPIITFLSLKCKNVTSNIKTKVNSYTGYSIIIVGKNSLINDSSHAMDISMIEKKLT